MNFFSPRAFPGLIALVAVLATTAAPASARTLYSTDRSHGVVYPINVATGVRGNAIAVGGGGLDSIAITPDGLKAYVTDNGANTVTPIDLVTRTAGAAIPVTGVRRVAIAPDGTTAYVVSANPGRLTPIDVASDAKGPGIAVDYAAWDVAIGPDGRTAYVTDSVLGPSPDYDVTYSVLPVDLSTGNPGTPIPLGAGQPAITITPDGKTAYTTNFLDHTVTPIDLASGQPGAPIPAPGDLWGIAASPDGRTVYVTNRTSTVLPIDVATNQAGPGINADPSSGGHLTAYGVAFTPDSKTAFVTTDGPVARIDVATATGGDGASQTWNIGSSAGIAVVPNQAPTAAFSAVAADPGSASTFDASASADSDGGSIAKYLWDFGDGTTIATTTATTTHVYSHSGTFAAKLRVVDDEGCSDALVFTGQTASCNGKPRAAVNHDVPVTALADLRLTAGPAGSDPYHASFTASGQTRVPAVIHYFVEQGGTGCGADWQAEHDRPGSQPHGGNAPGGGPFSFANTGLGGTSIVCAYLYAQSQDVLRPPLAFASLITSAATPPSSGGPPPGAFGPPPGYVPPTQYVPPFQNVRPPISGGAGSTGRTVRCVVPAVKRLKLAAARRALTRAHCRVGSVRYRKARASSRGRVLSSSARPGGRHASGFKVALVLGRR